MTKYAVSRDGRIDEYLASVGAKQPLDLLFISHAHADHLNGVERLLDIAKGLSVKTIVLPLLNVEDRLVAYARAASEDAASADTPFYQAFVIAPSAALARFNPDRIIFVEPGNRNGGAPFSGGPDGPADGRPNLDTDLLGKESLSWKVIGSGAIRRDGPASAQLKAGMALVIPDTLALISSAGTQASWLFAPFVDPTVKSGTASFIASLAKARGQTVAALKKWLRKSSNVEKLLTIYVSDLKTAYATLHTDLNVTSMCLYSGPVPVHGKSTTRYLGRFGTWRISGPGKSGVGWLGTGDAALADKKRRTAFFKHYGKLLDEVVTLTLPHHGSDHNFDPSILEQIQPAFCIASADQYASWKHPGTEVSRSISSTGRFMSVVTSNVRSEVREWVSIG